MPNQFKAFDGFYLDQASMKWTRSTENITLYSFWRTFASSRIRIPGNCKTNFNFTSCPLCEPRVPYHSSEFLHCLFIVQEIPKHFLQQSVDNAMVTLPSSWFTQSSATSSYRRFASIFPSICQHSRFKLFFESLTSPSQSLSLVSSCGSYRTIYRSNED